MDIYMEKCVSFDIHNEKHEEIICQFFADNTVVFTMEPTEEDDIKHDIGYADTSGLNRSYVEWKLTGQNSARE